MDNLDNYTERLPNFLPFLQEQGSVELKNPKTMKRKEFNREDGKRFSLYFDNKKIGNIFLVMIFQRMLFIKLGMKV